MSEPEAAGAKQGADARYAARSGAVQVLTILAQALLTAGQVVFARLYGRSIYGAYLASLAVLDVFTRGGTAGADKAMLRYVAAFRSAGDPASVRSALGTGLRLYLGLSGTFMLVILFSAPWLAASLHDASLTPVLRILAPLPVLMGGLYIVIQASLATRTTRVNFIVRGLCEPSLLLTCGVAAWLLGGGLRALAVAQVVASAVTLVLAMVIARRIFRPEETSRVLAAPPLAGFARFSLPMAAGEMLNALVQRADMIILTTLRGPEAAALYGAAELLTRAISNIRYAFDSIVAGVLSESLHSNDLERLRYNLTMVVRWVVSVAAPITVTLIVVRQDLLTLLFGSVYATGAAALTGLALASFVNSSLGLTGWVLMVAGHSRLGFFNNLIAVSFNLPAAYFLIRHFGAAGAAFAALGTAVILQVTMVVEVAYLQRVHPFSFALLKPLAAAMLVLAVESVVARVVPFAALRVATVVVAGAAVYVIGLVVLGLPAEERAIFKRIVRAVRPEAGGGR